MSSDKGINEMIRRNGRIYIPSLLIKRRSFFMEGLLFRMKAYYLFNLINVTIN